MLEAYNFQSLMLKPCVQLMSNLPMDCRVFSVDSFYCIVAALECSCL